MRQRLSATGAANMEWTERLPSIVSTHLIVAKRIARKRRLEDRSLVQDPRSLAWSARLRRGIQRPQIAFSGQVTWHSPPMHATRFDEAQQLRQFCQVQIATSGHCRRRLGTGCRCRGLRLIARNGAPEGR